MHADLCSLGFEGSYDRVAAFAGQRKVDQLDGEQRNSKGLNFDHPPEFAKHVEPTLPSEGDVVRVSPCDGTPLRLD